MMSKTIDDALTTIAQDHLHIPTLAVRNSDSLDFHDLGVAELRDALKAAYAAGAIAVAQGKIQYRPESEYLKSDIWRALGELD